MEKISKSNKSTTTFIWNPASDVGSYLNPIPTGHGRNQPIYERHVTKSGRNRVNGQPDLLTYLRDHSAIFPGFGDGFDTLRMSFE